MDVTAGRVPPTSLLAHTKEQLGAALASRAGPIAVVPTMGALHEGHAALLRAARARAETVVVTIFVNPLQFGAGEDFQRYPRTFQEDLRWCAAEAADVVFAPAAEVLYPQGTPLVTVHPGALGERLEGATRPGHFAGVLTVVTKLLNCVGRVDAALFGEKDYQQLVLIRRMVVDLDLQCEIVAVPTVREPDGLARSSRNRYLSPEQRRDARALSTALRAGAQQGRAGAAAVQAAAQAVLAATPAVQVDYLELAAPDLGPVAPTGPARLLVAARVGSTRLIDNTAVWLGPEPTPA